MFSLVSRPVLLTVGTSRRPPKKRADLQPHRECRIDWHVYHLANSFDWNLDHIYFLFCYLLSCFMSHKRQRRYNTWLSFSTDFEIRRYYFDASSARPVRLHFITYIVSTSDFTLRRFLYLNCTIFSPSCRWSLKTDVLGRFSICWFSVHSLLWQKNYVFAIVGTVYVECVSLFYFIY